MSFGRDSMFPGIDCGLEHLEGTRLHAMCLRQMSRFMLEPTHEQATLVCTLLRALSRHHERHRSQYECDPYDEARAIWLRVAQHVQRPQRDEGTKGR